jgi:hypothetical protein
MQGLRSLMTPESVARRRGIEVADLDYRPRQRRVEEEVDAG